MNKVTFDIYSSRSHNEITSHQIILLYLGIFIIFMDNIKFLHDLFLNENI